MIPPACAGVIPLSSGLAFLGEDGKMRALLRSAWSESAAAWRGTEAVITAPIRNRLGAIAPRGFESHPVRHPRKGPRQRVFLWVVVRAVWTNPPGSTDSPGANRNVIAYGDHGPQAIFGRRARRRTRRVIPPCPPAQTSTSSLALFIARHFMSQYTRMLVA